MAAMTVFVLFMFGFLSSATPLQDRFNGGLRPRDTPTTTSAAAALCQLYPTVLGLTPTGPWCGCNGVVYPLRTYTYNADPTSDCDYSVLPTGSQVETASANPSVSLSASASAASATSPGTTVSATSAMSLTATASAASSTLLGSTVSAASSGSPNATGTPCSAGDPSWALTQDNWVQANVDGNLVAWWAGQAPNNLPPAPVTSNDPVKGAYGLAQQLAAQAANVQTFQCQMAADIACEPPQSDYCSYKNMPKWAYFAWVAMYELHQSMKALNTAANTAISQAQSLAENLVTTFERNSGETDTFISQLALQAISPILTIAGIFIPLPKGIGNTRPAPAVHPVPPEDVGALYGLLPGAVVGAATGIWSKLDSGTVDPSVATGALQTILVALQNNVSTVIEDMNDNMFWDAAGANNLMNMLSGGFFLQPTNISNTDAVDAWTVDVLSRVINNVWRGYATYVSFTDLSDDAAGSKCAADTVGPPSSKYCADGGVYYLNNFDRNSGHLDKPYGYDSLVDHGITPANITKASAQAYRAKGIITGTPALGTYDDVASQQVVANIGDGNGRQLLGGLPGEWTLPVCAQGTNYWTWNYESGTLGSGSNTQGNSMFPCACGPQGGETAAFLAAANFNYQNTYMQESALADGCTDILANQPLGRGNVIHNSNSPGWDGIAGGHPTTLDLGDGTTIPYGRVCTQTQAGRKCTGP